MLHVLRVFIGPGGCGGNPLGVFVEGAAIAPERRQAVAHDLNFSETVFVDSLDDGVARIAIHPGHRAAVRRPSHGRHGLAPAEPRSRPATLRCAAGDVPAWQDGELAWIRARPDWVHGIPEPDRLACAAAVDSVVPPGWASRATTSGRGRTSPPAGSGLASSRRTWGSPRTRPRAPPRCCSVRRSGAT